MFLSTTAGRIALTCMVLAAVLLVLALVQWDANQDCVIPLNCEIGPDGDCLEQSCRESPWWFGMPAIGLAVAAAVLFGLQFRQRGSSP